MGDKYKRERAEVSKGVIERWAPCPGFPGYEVSSFLRARNTKTGRILRVRRDKEHLRAYMVLDGQSKTANIAKLAWIAFRADPFPANISKFGTAKTVFDLEAKGYCSGRKIGLDDVRDIVGLRRKGASYKTIAGMLGISYTSAADYVCGRRKHPEQPVGIMNGLRKKSRSNQRSRRTESVFVVVSRVRALVEQGLSVRKAAQELSIPQRTLRRWLKSTNAVLREVQ